MHMPFSALPTKKKIAAVGSALVDICLIEDEAYLAATGAPKGGMTITTSRHIQELLGRSENRPIIVPGGSACNTILGIGKLGNSARFIGKRGNDNYGTLFEEGVHSHGVEPVLQTSSTPTGNVLSIITPDAQRTMFTFLGASSEMDPGAITPDLFTDVALVHIEGYLLFNHDLICATLKAAKTAGVLISLDLASFTVVETSKSLLETLCEQYVDILIANEDEARAFTGFSDEKQALDALSRKTDCAVLKVGKRGSYITHNGTTITVPRMGDGHAVDTTGAGDLWAAGFLFGLVNGFPLDACGKIGSACGYEVCQVIGAQIPDAGWKRIRLLFDDFSCVRC
ncbi:MAG: adenosine kinase [Chitinispirillaceae bacterium]|nr:adenosine kinase [Chitinispirillaceae bacterium]